MDARAAVRSLAVAALVCAAGCGSGAGQRASVLLITLDTTRADALGCYGGPAWVSPNLDRLAREGVRFDAARTVTGVTLPAHASILTGQLPFEHGVRDNTTFRLPASATTLAERLGRLDYATAAVVGTFVLHSDFGLDQGFDVYLDIPRRQLENIPFVDRRKADEVVDEALALLDRGLLEPPYLLWVHFYDPHRPYDPPPEFAGRAFAGVDPASLPENERWRRAYHGEIAFADAQVGRLLEALRRAPGGDDLLTAVVADHGEGLGDHGEEIHGLLLYDTTIRVPMILHHRSLSAGRVVSEPVSVADLAPTILALAGDGDLSTGPLSELLAGRGARGAGPPVYFEACNPYYSYGWSPLFGLIEDGMKVIEGPVPELFDLRADPAELRDLHAGRPDVAARGRAALAAMAPRTATSQRIEVTPEDQGRLAALGYAGSASSSDDVNAWPPGHIEPGLRDPKHGLALERKCNEALRKLAAGDVSGAVLGMEEVIALDGSNPFFLGRAGEVYYAAGRYADAERVLRRSLQYREDANVRDTMAVALFTLQRPDEAVRELQRNVAIHPRHLHTRLALGEMLFKLGRTQEALEALSFFLDHYQTRDQYYQAAEGWKRQAERVPRRQ